MNKLTVIAFTRRNTFAPTFTAVEGVTPEGVPFTFGVIYHNKHGRHNLVRPGGAFMAGSRNLASVRKYAKTVNPLTTDKVFINAGCVEVLPERSY